jgi:hypothetical protein
MRFFGALYKTKSPTLKFASTTRNFLSRFSFIFAFAKTWILHINTITNEPIKLFAYRKSYYDREILNDQILTMLKAYIIRPSSSPWSFPFVLVGKSDKTKRLCVNYKRLNDITVNDPFPLT